MQRDENTFTIFEGFSLLAAILLFHIYSNSLPRMAEQCGNASWIAQLLGGVFAIGLFLLYYLLFRMFPGRNLLQISKEIFGAAGSKLIALLLFLYFGMIAVVNLQESLEILTGSTYAQTRTLVLSISFLLVAVIVASYPVMGLARITSVCVPLFALAILLILILSYKQYDPTYLTPLLGYGIKPIARMSVTQLTCYDGLLVIGVFLDSFSSTKAYKKSGLRAVGACAVLFFLSTLFYSMASPYQALPYNRTGLLDLAQSIYINRFFQRFESVFIIFLSMGKILLLCITLIAMKRVYCDLITMPEKKEHTVLFPIALLLLTCTQVLENMVRLRETLSDFMRSYSLCVVLGMLAVFLTGGWLRTRKGGGGKPIRTVCMLLVCCLCGSLFSGCNNITEPDEEIFSIIMGYDKSDTETLRITIKVMPEDKDSAGGSGGGPDSEEDGAPGNVFSVDAPCNLPAVDLINTVIPKHISMLHVKMLVISEELAREDIDMIITPFIRYNEIKPSIAVIICKESAEEFISSESSELIPFLPLETEMIVKSNKINSSYLVRTMGEIYNDYIGNYGDPLVMYGGLAHGGTNKKPEEEEQSPDEEAKDSGEGGSGDTSNMLVMSTVDDPDVAPWGEEKKDSASLFYDDPNVGVINGYLPGDIPIKTNAEPQIAGMAVFRGKQMVGVLNTHETAMFAVADGSCSGAILPLRDPYVQNYYVILYIRNRQENKVKTNIDENGIAHINVECFLQADLKIVHNSEVNYEKAAEGAMLKQYTELYLEEQIQSLTDKLQKEYGSDALRLGRYVAGNFLTIAEWEAYDWPGRYKDAEINVKVNVRL